MSAFVRWLDQRFYPTESGAWDNKRYRDLVLPLLKSTDRVLDLGAGRGRIPEMNFRGLVQEVVGIDPDPCVTENPYLDSAIVATEPTAPLPFPDESFDVVITSNVLEHVSTPADLFAEVHRVLRSGGLFVNKTPNSGHYVAAIASLTPHAFHEWVNARRGRAAADTYPTFYRANSQSAIRTLAAQAGFDVVRLGTWEGPPNYLRILPPAYPLGVAYERIVNSSDVLSHFRAVLTTVLKRV
jgi:SAM-dependent methyltransferase